MLVHWRKDANAEGDDGRGYWHSNEGRFRISPNFRHTINPDSYTVTDYVGEWAPDRDDGTKPCDRTGRRLRVWKEATRETVRECKAWAEARALKSEREG